MNEEKKVKLYVRIGNRNNLPSIVALIDFMWDEGINASRAGNSHKLSTCTRLALCWDKWVDEIRFKGHPRFKEYIYFNHRYRRGEKSSQITIEVDDGALYVDQRAFFRAAFFLAMHTGRISLDGEVWLTCDEFKKAHCEYFMTNFKQAVEKSLNE